MPDRVIVDTSVLIALEKIDSFFILCYVYKEVILPESVVKEFGVVNIKCGSPKKVESKLINLLTVDLNLGRGITY